MKQILSFLFVAISFFCFSQIPADSLPGEYVGLMYYKSPTTNPWTITQDTLYVSNVDTLNCSVTIISYISNFGGTPTLYTTYYSCNAPAPSNVYFLFYSNDSLKMIFDNMAAPPPNPMYSREFFGKRISNKTAGVNEILNSEVVKVFPNPASDVLIIESKKQMEEITITDLLGREVKNEKVKSQIDISDLKEGVYFVQIKANEGTAVKKIVVR